MTIEFEPGAIERYRTRALMTQAELADAAGLTVSTVSRLESGLQAPRISTVRRIASALNVDPSELLQDETKKLVA